jgi:hypothetical protein
MHRSCTWKSKTELHHIIQKNKTKKKEMAGRRDRRDDEVLVKDQGAGIAVATRVGYTPAQTAIAVVKTRIAELHTRDAEALEQIQREEEQIQREEEQIERWQRVLVQETS